MPGSAHAPKRPQNNSHAASLRRRFPDPLIFYIGKEGRIKFDKPGTYDYTVHISGVKAHAHTGTVVVK
jgi:hypothetical protein